MVDTRSIGFVLALFLVTVPVSPTAQTPAAPRPDKPGCSDHALFTRMQDMRIESCKAVDFDRFNFKTGKPATAIEPVEGKRDDIRYQIKSGQAPSKLAMMRNYQQAIKAIGGKVVFEDDRLTTLKVEKNGKEVWAQVDTAWGGGYLLTIVEKQAMVQEVVASADLFASGLKTTGHVEVPGIFFDTGKAELKPESDAAIAEVAKVLKADAGLKVFVVGHTDNTSTLDVNTKLSQARADAVVQALVAKHGIAAARVAGRGVGPLSPVASNDSEEGRARNRRVELVKQ